MTGRVKKRTGIERALARSEEPVLPDIGNPPWAACTIPARDVNPSRAVPADKLYPEWTYPVNIPIARPAPRWRAQSGLPAAGSAAHGDFPAQPRSFADREGGVIRCWCAGSAGVLARGRGRAARPPSPPPGRGLDPPPSRWLN